MALAVTVTTGCDHQHSTKYLLDTVR